MAILIVSTRHGELRRVSSVEIDENDRPRSEPLLISTCRCGAEIATRRSQSSSRDQNGEFFHDVAFREHAESSVHAALVFTLRLSDLGPRSAAEPVVP